MYTRGIERNDLSSVPVRVNYGKQLNFRLREMIKYLGNSSQYVTYYEKDEVLLNILKCKDIQDNVNEKKLFGGQYI